MSPPESMAELCSSLRVWVDTEITILSPRGFLPSAFHQTAPGAETDQSCPYGTFPTFQSTLVCLFLVSEDLE